MSDLKRFAVTGSAYDRPEASFDADLAPVGRGTPMGELLRRYWHPVYKSDKLTDLPVQVRLLGDDIILFRKPTGEVGAVYPRCVHRGTTLLYGKVTDKGIRCCYHGWTFETDGRCTDQPCEPEGGKRKELVRQPWYPAEERYGLVFVYTGPLDKKPPLPHYDLLENIPDGWEIYADDTSIPSAGAGYIPCNWLQHYENGMDPAHVAVVHEHQFPPIMAKAESTYSFERLDDRIAGRGISKIGPMMMDFRVNLLTPNVTVIPNPILANPRPDGKGDSVSWAVAKDDTDTIVFTALTRPVGAVPSPVDLYNGKAWTELSFEEHQRFPGDFEAQVGQGAITYHSEEHLLSSDQGIIYLRRQLRAAVKSVAEGLDAPFAFGHNEIYVETTSSVQMMPNPDYIDDEAEEIAVSDAPAAPSSIVTGSWNLTMKTPMGEQKATIAFAETGGGLMGIMSGSDGDVQIKDGKVDGRKLHWKADVKKPMALTLKFDVNIDGDRMTGSFKAGMFPSATVTGVRV